jgi:hypothetical protein
MAQNRLEKRMPTAMETNVKFWNLHILQKEL